VNTSDILIETLIDWGATHVFGIVGDGINSIIESLRKRQDRIRYIAVRHEEAAAFMACGWAKHTGGSRRLRWHDRARRDPSDERSL
jgi:pyruvate dehydrogenase (quinone)